MAQVSKANSLDALLDELELQVGRNDDQRSALKSEPEESGSEVFLNVYDMIGLNYYLSYFGIGAFHTGVQVYGVEYAYGGHPYSYSGVYSMTPRQEGSISTQGGVRFKETVHIGYTTRSKADVVEIIKAMGKEYNGNVYSMFNKNCNHFCSALCNKLCGTHIPLWVNRLAYVCSWMPWAIRCLPPNWVASGSPNPTQQEGEPSTSTSNRFLCSPQSLSQSRPSTSKSEEGEDC